MPKWKSRNVIQKLEVQGREFHMQSSPHAQGESHTALGTCDVPDLLNAADLTAWKP